MPNTPARLGRGMTVWYATPECTSDQRAQAAALLGALGKELEVDDETWARGRGWALSIALIALPYYKETNPGLAGTARHLITEVLADV